jgi:DNA-binding protein H-NS
MKTNILEKANEIINLRSEEKERMYGPFDESIIKAAKIATELCNKEITPEDFFKCLIALKLSRLSFNYKEDTFLDSVAYIAAFNNYLNNKNK